MALTAVGYLLMHRNKAPETSSSSSDEEWDAIIKNYNRENRQLRPRIIDYENVIFRYSDEEFKSHFRISRNTFNYLHDIIEENLVRHVPGCPTIPSHHQLMIALWKMATMDSYRSVCDRFNVGRATAVRAVRRVCHALFIKSSRFIQWPTGERAIEVMHGFERASGFPKVIGAIDGTHIRINGPKQNHADYINRKGFHSIQLQVVCDHKTLITHCYAGHPGSVHDQRVFRLSEVADYVNDDDKFLENCHMLGDAAYEIHQHLLTPYRDNGHLTGKQKNYNYRHSAARVTVERCIGLLKGRMRSLLHCLPMTRVDLMAEYIIACCVIHNICILQGDELNVITIPEHNQGNVETYSREVRRTAGVIKRDAIMNSL
ncbi:putative nuclease HARBI1 [Pieris napi]|uniref:putative nuclease HARBI1 n=1 Tax=Pieris napi TaxID=78633 RepID=UPI001FB87B9B|nr:putative nuclease HARBI1 [Pieris napi]